MVYPMNDGTPAPSGDLPDSLSSVLLSALPCAVIVTDLSGSISWVNPGFSEICGYGPEEVLGRKPGEFLQGAGTDRATVVRIRKALKRRERCSERILNYDKRGRSYWISLDISPYEADGREGFVAVVRDLTQGFVEPPRRALGLEVGHLMSAVEHLARAANEEQELHQFCLSLADALASLKRSGEQP